LKDKENNVFHNNIVINDNHGQIGEPKIINQQAVYKSNNLLEELLDFLEKVKEDKSLSKKTKQEVIKETSDLIKDLTNDNASKNRLKQFHQFLHQTMPEMQLMSTCSGVISAISDILK